MAIRRPLAQAELYQCVRCRRPRIGAEEQMIELDAHAYDSTPRKSLIQQPVQTMRSSRLPEEDGNDVSGGEVGAVWWEDDVAIGAGVCGKVARAVPANALYAGADAL
jgi:hypothetical protein